MLISSPWKIVPHRYYPQAQDSSKHNNIGQSLRKENILLNRNSEFSDWTFTIFENQHQHTESRYKTKQNYKLQCIVDATLCL